MQNPVKRIFKLKVPQPVNLSLATGSATVPDAAYEVTEYDHVAGMEQWKDSGFVQDFEGSVVNIPGTLFEGSKPETEQSFDMLDPFASVGRKSG